MPDDSKPSASTSESPQDVRTLDPRSLRGLAHPLRMRLLMALRQHGSATASQLADQLGESSGATSYHLRQLAAYGFVEDDPGRGKGRERWWKAAHQGTVVDGALYSDPNPEVRGAMNTYIHEVASIHGQEVGTWLGTMQDWSDDWLANSDLSDFTLRLTPALLREMEEKVHALISSYQDHPLTADAEDAARVRVHLHAFPQKTTDASEG